MRSWKDYSLAIVITLSITLVLSIAILGGFRQVHRDSEIRKTEFVTCLQHGGDALTCSKSVYG